MPFEINKPLTGLLTGDITAHVHEYGSVEPITILEADKMARVHVIWTLSGPLTPFLCGKWYVSAFLESMGPGEEFRLPLAPGEAVALNPKPGPVTYEAWVDIPANRVKVTDTEGTLPYKLVVTVAYRAPNGQPGPMAGFVDGPVLQFYRVDVPA